MGVFLNWKASTVFDSHVIYRSVTPFNKYNLPTSLATTVSGVTEYQDDTTIEGKQYYYMIKSVLGSRVRFSEQVVVYVTVVPEVVYDIDFNVAELTMFIIEGTTPSNVLFAMSSWADYSPNPGWYTGGTGYDTGRVDGALSLTDDTSYPQRTNHAESANDYTWYSFRSYWGNYGHSGADGYLMVFKDASGNVIAVLDTLNGGLRMEARGDTSNFTSSYSIPKQSVRKHDCKITVTASTITVAYYVNNVQVGSDVSVSNTSSGFGKPVRMNIEPHDTIYATLSYVYISELFASSDSTINQRLRKVEPAANGYHQDMGGAYTELRDINYSTKIVGTSTGEHSSYTTPAYGGPADIAAVVITAAAWRSGAPLAGIKFGFRMSSEDYYGTQIDLSEASGVWVAAFELSPATDAAWTSAEVGSLEFGFRGAL